MFIIWKTSLMQQTKYCNILQRYQCQEEKNKQITTQKLMKQMSLDTKLIVHVNVKLFN